MNHKEEYSIKDLASLLSVSEHTIRKYENDFDLKIPRTDMNHRYYTDKELELFKRILDWKEKGFNKTTINNLLNHSVDAIEQREQAIELVTLDKLTGAELKDLMARQIAEFIIEKESQLHEKYEKKLDQVKKELEEQMEENLEKQRRKIEEQISAENQKLMSYIAATKEEKKKSLWDIFKR